MRHAVDDPWERQIRTRLDEKLEPDVFEECACDVLRDAYPTLVHIPGGNDRGMDGAIDDGKGKPYPLICTTAGTLEKVRANLKRSIERYRDTGGQRRRVVLATTRTLNRDAREDLEKQADQLGFLLKQAFGREDFVIRLRNRPHWCRKLVRLSGKPPALSVRPPRRRHLMEIEPVGRDADLEWLRGAREDRLLIGAPGSGKTFLLYRLAQEGWGYFLVGREEAEVLEAIAEFRPRVVIVDDAHEDIDRLTELVELRRRSEAQFVIVATTWKGDHVRVANAFDGLAAERMRELGPLTREQIVEVFRRAGVEAHETLMKRLVDMATKPAPWPGGRPGLAVTLAQLWQLGNLQDVLEGRALSRSLLPFFEANVGEDAEQILAAFSLGGDHGMPMSAVAGFLGLRPDEIQRKVIALAAGGALNETGGALSVWPRELRSVFLANVFFRSDGINLGSYRELLAAAPSLEKAARALVEARGYSRAAVPINELKELVIQAESPTVWALFAGLGEEEARWALANYPFGDWLAIAEPALYRAPHETVPRLLRQAALDYSENQASSPGSRPPALMFLADWIRELRATAEERLVRRRLTADESRRFLQIHEQPTSGVVAICLSLHPVLTETTQDPGSGTRIRTQRAAVAFDELSEIRKIWEDVRDVVTELDAVAWSELRELLRSLIDTSDYLSGSEPPPRETQAMQALAELMMSDLAPLTQGRPAFAARLDSLARKIDFPLAVKRDAEFDLLFPQSFHADREVEKQHRGRVEKMARRWSTRPPDEVLEQLRRYREEAQQIDQGYSQHSIEFLQLLASEVVDPLLWARTWIDQDADASLVDALVRRAVDSRCESWQELLAHCLDSEQYLELALSVILRLESTNTSILQRAVAKAQDFPKMIYSLSFLKEIPKSTLALLLDHSDRLTACAAALGQWKADPRGEVQNDLQDLWRRAVLAVTPQDLENQSSLSWSLETLLAEDSQLTFDWLAKRLDSGDLTTTRGYDSMVLRTVTVLGRSQRAELIDRLAESGSSVPWLVAALVDRDHDLYRRVLSDDRLAAQHWAPLSGLPDQDWAELALLALDAGCEPRRVVSESLIPRRPLVSDGYDHDWSQRERGFTALLHHPDPRLRRVAEHGKQIAAASLKDSLREQREREIRGLHSD